MEIRYFKEYSSHLNRDMEFKMYGHAGKLCLCIPCQDGVFYEWEDRGMFKIMENAINAGKIQFVTINTIDKETWSSTGNTGDRMWKQECWIQYIVQELIPSALAKGNQPADAKCLVTGFSLGAGHACNLAFRFPDRFDQCLALSGVYDMEGYYFGHHDQHTFENDPCAYLSMMDRNHEYVQKYNNNQYIFVVGQGAWEDVCLANTRKLQGICESKGIHCWFEYWGYDVNHDWVWWYKQFPYYMGIMGY